MSSLSGPVLRLHDLSSLPLSHRSVHGLGLPTAQAPGLLRELLYAASKCLVRCNRRRCAADTSRSRSAPHRTATAHSQPIAHCAANHLVEAVAFAHVVVAGAPQQLGSSVTLVKV